MKNLIGIKLFMLLMTLLATGCATVPEDLIPQSIVLAPDHLSFQGSIRVNVQTNIYEIGKSSDELIPSLELLASYIDIDEADLAQTIGIPNVVYPIVLNNKGVLYFPTPKENGQTVKYEMVYGLSEFKNIGKVRGASGSLMGLFKDALEKSFLKEHIFASVAHDRADYILDVWIDRTTADVPSMGIGVYKADTFSIWRLTRVSDGKMLACDYIIGHGTIDHGMQPLNRMSIATIQDLIRKGIFMLTDSSHEHFAAMVPAGINRPIMGGAVSTEVEHWNNRVRKNWTKLQKGMTINETETVIGPFQIKHPEWERRYRLPIQLSGSNGVLDFRIYKTNLFTLLYMSSIKNIMYSKEEKSHVVIEQSDLPKLLLWKLNKEAVTS